MHLPVAVFDPDRLAFLESMSGLADRVSLRQKAPLSARIAGDPA
jgi:hypothetical protein